MPKLAFHSSPTAVVKIRNGPSGIDLDGEWNVVGVEEEFAAVEVTAFGSNKVQTRRHNGSIRMSLRLRELRPVTAEEVERQRVESALADQPPEVKKAVEALFQIEKALGPDHEAIVEVETEDNGKPKFTVTTRPNPRPLDEQTSDWYKRWKRP